MRFSSALLAAIAVATVSAQSTVSPGFAAYQFTYQVSSNTDCLKTYWAAVKQLSSSCSSFFGDEPVAAGEDTAASEGDCLCLEVPYDGNTPSKSSDFNTYVTCVEKKGKKNVKQGMVDACQKGIVASGTAAASSTAAATTEAKTTATTTATTTTTGTASPGAAAASVLPVSGVVAAVLAVLGAVL